MSRRPIHFLFIQNFISQILVLNVLKKCRANSIAAFIFCKNENLCTLILVIKRPLILMVIEESILE